MSFYYDDDTGSDSSVDFIERSQIMMEDQVDQYVDWVPKEGVEKGSPDSGQGQDQGQSDEESESESDLDESCYTEDAGTEAELDDINLVDLTEVEEEEDNFSQYEEELDVGDFPGPSHEQDPAPIFDGDHAEADMDLNEPKADDEAEGPEHLKGVASCERISPNPTRKSKRMTRKRISNPIPDSSDADSESEPVVVEKKRKVKRKVNRSIDSTSNPSPPINKKRNIKRKAQPLPDLTPDLDSPVVKTRVRNLSESESSNGSKDNGTAFDVPAPPKKRSVKRKRNSKRKFNATHDSTLDSDKDNNGNDVVVVEQEQLVPIGVNRRRRKGVPTRAKPKKQGFTVTANSKWPINLTELMRRGFTKPQKLKEIFEANWWAKRNGKWSF